MEKLELVIANNLTYLRKKAKLTQLEFGEKFNYSDKTVSKWELGTVVPSVEVLKEIADFYGVTVDYILTEHHDQKEYDSEIIKSVNPREKLIFIGLALAVVWSIAAAVFAVGYLREMQRIFWISFIVAIPVSFLVMAYFVRRYFKRSNWALIFMSCFVWTTIASVYLYELIKYNYDKSHSYWFLFIIGVPVQAFLLLLMLKKHGKK